MQIQEYGPYVRRSTRVIAILQLSLVFSYLCWVCAHPFIDEHFSFKKQGALYKTVFGHQDLTLNVSEDKIIEIGLMLQRNSARFERLPPTQQERLEQEYHQLTSQKGRHWGQRLRIMWQELVHGIPPFIQAYLVFSLALCFMLLLRIDGASTASLLLPLLIGIHIYYNHTTGVPAETVGEATLFPSEEVLVSQYVDGELSSNIGQQYEQLQAAWHGYLLDHWYQGSPSSEPTERALQVEEAEFALSLARLGKLKEEPQILHQGRQPQVQGSLFLQIISFLWSLFFAFFVNRSGATDPEPSQ